MVDITSAAVSRVIGNIYEAAYEPAKWQVAIENLENLFQGSKACLQKVSPNIGPGDVVATKVDPFFHELFLKDFANHFDELRIGMDVLPLGRVCLYRDYFGDEILRTSRFRHEWMLPQDMHDGLICKFMESGSSYWLLDVQRGRNQQYFDTEQFELMHIIAPHVLRATQIGQYLGPTRAFFSVFNHIPFGVVVVDGDMQIMAANDAAETHLRKPDGGIISKSGRIVFGDKAVMTLAQQWVAQACSTYDGIQPGTGGGFTLRHHEKDRSALYAVSIAPLSPQPGESWLTPRQAVVFIREVSLAISDGFIEEVRQLFRLSPREATLAASLCAGQSLKDAATESGIRFSTARTYLESIMRKTDTHQQSQLVALLKSIHPLVARKTTS